MKRYFSSFFTRFLCFYVYIYDHVSDDEKYWITSLKGYLTTHLYKRVSFAETKKTLQNPPESPSTNQEKINSAKIFWLN